MSNPVGLTCIRCAKAFPITAYGRGCDTCLAQGVASNLAVSYAKRPTLLRDALPSEPRSMWRYAELMHAPAAEAVSLGEGLTPLVSADRLQLGALWLKDESRNPTWSFKDRLASASVTLAKKLGAKVIASSSSGNAGAASAAYAARAGLPCVIVTYAAAAGPMLTQMRANGAMLLTVPSSADRWRVLSAAVDRFGWYPTTVYRGPAVGSNPLGIEGYKSIAYEIAESMHWRVPDWCALPVCYCDALYGVWKGFDDLHRLGWIDRVPRLLAAEVSGSLTQAMQASMDMPPSIDHGTPSIATSIAALQATHQGVVALRRSDGRSVQVSDEAIVEWQMKLARLEGIYVEPSAAATLPAIASLRADGTIAKDASVVALLTATGLKDNAATERVLRATPAIAPDVDAAVRALREHYGFDAAH
ncbi:MAG: pyridoxal-phosphate dependent enzyme [Lautropia sp.]